MIHSEKRECDWLTHAVNIETFFSIVFFENFYDRMREIEWALHYKTTSETQRLSLEKI